MSQEPHRRVMGGARSSPRRPHTHGAATLTLSVYSADMEMDCLLVRHHLKLLQTYMAFRKSLCMGTLLLILLRRFQCKTAYNV